MNPHRLFFLLIGLLDLVSGWALMLFPDTIQSVLQLDDPLPSPSSRIVGAFVAGLGTLYVWAAVRPGAGERRLWHAYGLTAVVRFYVGAMFVALILSGQLGRLWLVVGVVDVLLAITQAVWWKRWKDRQG